MINSARHTTQANQQNVQSPAQHNQYLEGRVQFMRPANQYRVLRRNLRENTEVKAQCKHRGYMLLLRLILPISAIYSDCATPLQCIAEGVELFLLRPSLLAKGSPHCFLDSILYALVNAQAQRRSWSCFHPSMLLRFLVTRRQRAYPLQRAVTLRAPSWSSERKVSIRTFRRYG